MSTAQGSPSAGPGVHDYQPKHRDFVRNTYSYDPNKSEFKPSQYKHEYISYKPANIGIYGEKERTAKPRDPPPKPISRPSKQVPRTTFNSYGGPRGPDIPTGAIGPEYRYPEYQYTHYKPTTYEPVKYNGDFIAGKTYHWDENSFKPVSGTEKYQLTENNYGGFRHFHFGDINDPISAKGSQGGTQEKKIPAEKARKATPKKPEVKAVPVIAAVAAVPVAKSGPKTFFTTGTQYQQTESITQMTQTIVNTVKSTGIQYETSQTRAFGTQVEQQSLTSTGIQTDTPSPSPQVAPLVMAGNITSKVEMKTQGVQCSEPKTTVKTEARGTQYDQTPVSSRHLPRETDIYPVSNPEEKRRESPVYRAQRTQSPEVVPIIAATSFQRNASQKPASPQTKTKSPSPRSDPTPQKSLSRDSRWTPSPEVPLVVPVVTKDASVAKAKTPAQAKPDLPEDRHPSPKAPVSLPKALPVLDSPPSAVTAEQQPVVQSKPPKVFVQPKTENVKDAPNHPKRSRLPPEITAHIEAYNSVHTNAITGSLPSMQRSMALT
ncbi:nascent polypeptide-associated complex subunit alpha, muscle-specific form-like [Dreissena polymorpha]|uniref:Uncharacterized protein n=1 Tax=Dreissena polymorpha TaxID=45954 RepID=A0A9D4EQ77_DREPO|nr:nascent polypeptide-associated complex subunit alpha, muscle-specific form-like [Dreissena polymorpha]KAH3783758.1 hypothetical protein DPMN_161706 [Dreissena polymorpha]